MNRAYDMVVFDLAGTTVVDEGDVVSVELCEAVREVAGVELPTSAATALMGIRKPDAIRQLIEGAARPAPAELVERTHECFRRRMMDHYRTSPRVAEISGTTTTFMALRERGIKVCLDTGFSRDITEVIIDRMGWRKHGLIDASVTSDEVPLGRPAPFMIFKAMAELGLSDVSRVVKVGDTPSDLQEGRNAGCGRVVGVCRGSHTREQLAGHFHTDLIEDVSVLPMTLSCRPTPSLRLHTPGPANTSPTVRQAMTRDVGAWDRELVELATSVRTRIVKLGGLDSTKWDCVLLQGSGTYGVEATIGSAVPRITDSGTAGRLLVAANGAYGDRIARIAETLGIATVVVRFSEESPVDPAEIGRVLREKPDITTVAVVHCETTTGLLNDVAAVGRVVRAVRPEAEYVIDAMSSFGAYDLDWEAAEADWIVTSSNKCLQGTPGLACVVARRSRLEASAGRARSLALDLFDQWRGFESHGRFRFTPPTHVLLGLRQAIDELEAEGGVRARYQRYESMRRRLVDGMTRRGYHTLIQPEHRSCIISTFAYPLDAKFSYAEVYAELQAMGFVIYPGKLTRAETFRVGHIGDLVESDIDDLLEAFDRVQEKLGFATDGKTRPTLSPEPSVTVKEG